MKNFAVKQLDERDEEFAETLINLGMRRYVARTLAYLRNVNETKAVDLEKGAGMHQPEVSIAMKELKERGWINEREEKKPGKGRPYKLYSLKISVDKIISQFENQENISVKETLSKINRLKDLK